ncbi:hypothetical protein BSLG_005871 [Batrachochytrium salamandrivorans]|nr:hypothetical protein BSLG_005871 [Batrachochytrium salamandrivorans]
MGLRSTNGLNAKTCSTGEEQVKPKSTVKTRKQTSKGSTKPQPLQPNLPKPRWCRSCLCFKPPQVITALTATGAFYEWIITVSMLCNNGVFIVSRSLDCAYNVTTIESMENGKIDDLCDVGRFPTHMCTPIRHVFRNFQAVFGQRCICGGCLPAPSNGLVFPVNENGTLGLWPPRVLPIQKVSMEAFHGGATGKQRRVVKLKYSWLRQSMGSTEQEAEIVHLDETDESSTEFDSFEDDFDDNIDMDGIPRTLGSKDDLDSPRLHMILIVITKSARSSKRQQGFKKFNEVF